MFVGGHRFCWRAWAPKVVSISLNCEIHGSGDLDPPAVHPPLHPVQLAERVIPVLLEPEVPGCRVDGQAEAVPVAVGKNLLHISARFSAHLGSDLEERVVGGSGAVIFQPEDHPRQMGVVRFGAAELVVWAPVPERSQGEVLGLPSPADVADEYVELAILPEGDDAAVVVAERPGLVRRVGRLEGSHLYQVVVEGQGRPVPHEPIHPVPEQRRVVEVAGIGSGRALRPVQVHPGVCREGGMEGDPQEPPLRGEVHRQVQDRAVDGAVRDAYHSSGVLLQGQDVV